MKYNSDESALRNTWTEEELRATVTAYLDMYKKELEGTTFVKKHYYAELAARFQRSDKSFEYRMQNISYVCVLMGRAWVSGQGESVNILLNFTQFFETRIEYRFQIFTAHSCDFLLPSYARLA